MSKIYPIIQDAKLTRKLLVSGVIVIATEIIATIYAFLGLFGLVLINIPIFALILTILVIVNLLMFAVALKARESLGIRSALALIVWSGMVFGYWVFAPIYYLLSMHFDAIQLRWVVFAFIWEVPAVGGMFILLVLFLFRPLYRFLEGKSEEIKFEEFYKRLNTFPILIGTLLVAIVVFGYVIGTWQQRYFGHMPPVEQLKNILNGAISSVLVGVFLALLCDSYLNKLRFYINKEFKIKSKPLNKFTSKIVISTMLIIIAGIGMSAMLSFKSAQGLVRHMVVDEALDDFDSIFSNSSVEFSENEKKSSLIHLKKGKNGKVYVGEKNLKSLGLLDSTIEYVRKNSEGVIDDYQYDLKTIIFKVNPNTGEKIISVIYITDEYVNLKQGLRFSLLGGIFVLVTSGLIIIFYKRSIARPLALIQKSINDDSTNILIPALATGDEFEELSDAIVRYKSKLEQYNLDLESKVAEQTNELSKQVSEIGKKNEYLEDTKKAMFNVLEDAQNTEKLLKENNEELGKFKLAAENAYDHIIITDPDGIIVYANNAVSKTTGYTRDEVIGKTPALWSGNMPKEYYESMWKTIMTNKSTFAEEIKNKRKNGEEYIAQVSISPILDEEKNIKFYVGLERDISKERKLTEELRLEKEGVEKKVVERTEALSRAKDDISKGWLQIQQEKVRLTASINSLPLGFLMTDANLNVLIHNPISTRIFDLHSNELKIADVINKLGNKIDLLSAIKRSIAEKKLLLAKDIQLESKYLKISIVPIITNNTEVIGTVMLIEDTTEAKVLERARNEFFSIASHELRTPLTSIKGNTSLIQQYYSEALSDPSLKEMIDDIHESSNRLIMIVNDFLDVSRIDQGRITYKVEKVDVLDLVQGVVHDVQANATTKGIELNVENESTNCMGSADKDRTQQIVYNLIGNAIKFTDKGAVKINLRNTASSIEVRVIDTGAGISVESKSLLFRKFQQAQDNPLTRKSSSGTGLGLYISKTLAQGMKGDVVLESSETNVGSTFLFTIPIAS